MAAVVMAAAAIAAVRAVAVIAVATTAAATAVATAAVATQAEQVAVETAAVVLWWRQRRERRGRAVNNDRLTQHGVGATRGKRGRDGGRRDLPPHAEVPVRVG